MLVNASRALISLLSEFGDVVFSERDPNMVEIALVLPHCKLPTEIRASAMFWNLVQETVRFSDETVPFIKASVKFTNARMALQEGMVLINKENQSLTHGKVTTDARGCITYEQTLLLGCDGCVSQDAIKKFFAIVIDSCLLVRNCIADNQWAFEYMSHE